MRGLSTLLLVTVLSLGGTAQQWLAPGACWVHRVYCLNPGTFYHYQYVSDTVWSGDDVQVVEVSSAYVFQNQLFPNGPLLKHYFKQQGNVVFDHGSLAYPVPDASWDTLYVLGLPGDRWWPRFANQSCPPLGMLEIQDTGQVVIQGVPLRTWNLAYLDANGDPLAQQAWWGDTIGILERIGSMPGLPPVPCDTPIWDPCSFFRLHYSDDEIALPLGTSCDITTAIPPTRATESAIRLHPNPGTDQLYITSLVASATVEVRDPLGRLVHSRSNLPMNTPIETAAWESGTYFITVTDYSGRSQVIKWVKQ